MLDLGLTAATFGVIFLAELPDKSLFASLVLGTRYRPLVVWLGVSAAFVVHVVIAVAAGGVLNLLPHTPVQLVVAALFALGAWLLLRPQQGAGRPKAEQQEDERSEQDQPEQDQARPVQPRMGASPSSRRVLATSFGVVFVGEWGDITQIATANLTARYDDPLSVGVGAALALVGVAGLAVTAGRSLVRRIDVDAVRRVAGAVLAVLAVLTIVDLVR